MKRVYDLVWKHPRPILAFFLVVSVLLAYPATRIRLDSSVEGMMVKDDPDRAFLDRVHAVFGNDEILVVAVVGQETIFRPESLRKVKRISDAMQSLDGVRRVISLSTVYHILTTEEGIEVRPLMEEIPENDQTLQSLKSAVLDNDIFSNVIVSEDGTTAAVNIFLQSRNGEQTYQQEIVKRLQQVISHEEGPEEIYLAGVPYSKIGLYQRMQGDLIKFIPLTVIVIAVSLFVSFGTLWGVAIPLVCVGLATVWTMGVITLLGKSISVISSMVPSLILVVGSAYTIHVVAQYYESITSGGADGQRLTQAFSLISIPVAAAAITTMAGFASIMMSPIEALRDFGLFGTIGILFSLVFSLLFAPAIFAVLRPVHPRRLAMRRMDQTEIWLTALAAFNVRRRKSILAGSVILLFVGIAGIGHLKVDTDYVGWLKKTDPLVLELNAIERRLAGSVS